MNEYLSNISCFWFKNLTVKILMSSLFLFLNLFLNANAQPQDIKFDCLTLEDGLSQTTVLSIIQDEIGYMWFGTVDGLNKFDGCNFTVYTHNPADSNTISDDWISSMCVDQRGSLWIGTFRGGLNKYDPIENKFVHYYLNFNPQNNSPLFRRSLTELPSNFTFLNCNSITSIYKDKMGILWIGTFGNGLLKFDRVNEQFIRSEYWQKNDYDLTHNIMSIHETQEGVLWIGTFGGGLVKLDQQQGITIYSHDPLDPNSLSDNRIMAIFPDTDCNRNVLWIGTLDGGLNKFHIATEKFFCYQHDSQNSNSISGNSVLSLFKDKCDILWIGTLNNGLVKFDIEKSQFSQYRHDPFNAASLGSNEILSLYEDRSGIIWIGTNLGRGLHKLDKGKNKFIYYFHDPRNSNSLSDNVVFSILEDKRGTLWIGTFHGGLNKFDRTTNEFTHYQHDPLDPNSISDNHIRAIYEDSQGDIWICTFTGGLNKFDHKDNRFLHYTHDATDPTSLSGNQVRAICEDQFGTLWIGTFGGGLNRFNRTTGTFTHYRQNTTDPYSLSDDRIYSIISDGPGTLWIATFDGGLNKFDMESEKFTHYCYNPYDVNSLSDNRVFSILQDPIDENILWLGTAGGGLNKFSKRTQSFTHYNEADGLPNNVVYGILADDNGNLWMSTNKGVSKFNTFTETFTNYDVSDGLQSNEFNAGAYCKSQTTGEMFFGGIKGFNSFYPDKVEVNTFIPPIKITSFKIFDKDMTHLIKQISETQQLELSYKDNFLSFEFSALDYTNLEKNQFAYKLEGFNEDWIHCGTRRFVNYTNLDPGEYTFRVKGSNSDGIWNEEGTFINLKINPPIWKTWWFYFTTFGTILLVAFIFHKQRVRINIKRSLEIERIRVAENERVRKTLAADFHDELGQKLTRISLFSEILKRKFKTVPLQHVEYIDKINSVANELSNNTRDFIWTLDPEQDSLYDVTIYLKDFGDEIFDKTGIDFRVNGISKEFENIKLPVEWRRHLTLIFKEGMNNALRHAKCKNVMFNIVLNQRYLKITLTDDGMGCSGNENSSGLGFNNMKNRAKSIHSTVKIISTDGKGTTIQFVGEIPQIGY